CLAPLVRGFQKIQKRKQSTHESEGLIVLTEIRIGAREIAPRLTQDPEAVRGFLDMRKQKENVAPECGVQGGGPAVRDQRLFEVDDIEAELFQTLGFVGFELRPQPL